MKLLCKYNIWGIWTKRNDNQMVANRKTIKIVQGRERRRGKEMKMSTNLVFFKTLPLRLITGQLGPS
jgi:hypothetical protein